MTRLYSLYQFRVRFISALFFICSLAILGKMFYIQTFQASNLRQITMDAGFTERLVKGHRGHISDRNGQILAETVKTYTFWVNTQKDVDRDVIATLFSTTFNQPLDIYQNLLSKRKKYIPLTKALNRSQCLPILEKLKETKGLQCDVSANRYYPFHNLASQVVGYVDQDHKGQFGIERQFDPLLNGKTSNLIYNRSANGRLRKAIVDQHPAVENGADIQLTIDANIQTILTEALKQGMKRSGALTANGVILNPFTGDILAMASLPDFDPNAFWKYDVSTFANRTISDAYEPGSTFKLISMTAALETEIFTAEDKFFCENGEYQILPSKIIHDHEPHGNLSLSDIFIYSSNIGLAKMVDQMGAQHIYDYARKFGFGIRTGVPLPSEASGVLREFNEWTRLSGPFVSMGQEISINTLQLALAYSAAANGGYLPNARIIKNISGNGYEERDYSPKPVRKVMTRETSEILLSMMEDVVNHGTANKARIPGFRIGGKTGTAEKFVNGAYSKREFISSFAAVFPIGNPKYVCVISVDSPKYGYHWGNETAAPIVKEIFERLIINNKEFIPVTPKEMPQFAHTTISQQIAPMLATAAVIQKQNNLVPNFLGKTLKQTIQEAKDLGLIINPVGTSGRVVWQSVSPGQLVDTAPSCTIKLESM
jgi:cell division protein FtsI/penicillin-binding protein 2